MIAAASVVGFFIASNYGSNGMLLEYLPWVNMNKGVNVFEKFCPDLRLDYFCIAVNCYIENVLNW